MVFYQYRWVIGRYPTLFVRLATVFYMIWDESPNTMDQRLYLVYTCKSRRYTVGGLYSFPMLRAKFYYTLQMPLRWSVIGNSTLSNWMYKIPQKRNSDAMTQPRRIGDEQTSSCAMITLKGDK